MSDTPIKHNYFLIITFLVVLVALIYQLVSSIIPDALAFQKNLQIQTLKIAYNEVILMIPSMFFAIAGIYLIFIIPMLTRSKPFKSISFGFGLVVIALSLFLAAHFMGTTIMTALLNSHGYTPCERLSTHESNMKKFHAFVLHPDLCSINIPLGEDTSETLTQKIQDGSITLQPEHKKSALSLLQSL